MSTRAYRVEILEIADDATFNLSKNFALAEALDMHEEFNYVQLHDLEDVIERAIDGKLDLSIGELEALASDVRHAKEQKITELLYECY